jgi:hypothetical protein
VRVTVTVTGCAVGRDETEGFSVVGVSVEFAEGEVVFVSPKMPPVAPVAWITERALCSLVQESILNEKGH